MCQRVDREKAPRTEGVNQRRKHIFASTPTVCVGWAAWAGKVGFGLREERGQRGRLGRRLSGPVRVAGPKVKKKDFELKIRFLNLLGLWKFAQGNLGGILKWGFFLNSSMLLKYFRKMKYVMPWYAILGKLINAISPPILFIFKMQPNALLLRQNFIIRKKWVLQTYPP
jgi:hypothetical protein